MIEKKRKIKVIVTLGPSIRKERDLRKIKAKGVDFVRVNMSHSDLEDLEYFIKISKNVGIPFILDTEGSQIRTTRLKKRIVRYSANDKILIRLKQSKKNCKDISLRPESVFYELEEGDLIYVDFNALVIQVLDIKDAFNGYLVGKVLIGGHLKANKAVIIHNALNKQIDIPPLSEKDLQTIKIAQKEGVKYIAASFIKSEKCINAIRKATKGRMKIISKIERREALNNLDDIMKVSDYLLIDRGDLSKDIPFERVPFIQKLIIDKANKSNRGVYIATNLLETMVYNDHPTKAEVQDVVNTIIEGAMGLTLSAETAVGKHPHESINVLNRLIRHTTVSAKSRGIRNKYNELVKNLLSSNYIADNTSSALITPHGGKLINRILRKSDVPSFLEKLKRVELNLSQQMDVEQIAIGTFSPLAGFLGKEDFESVLDNMRLSSGIIWPIPIVLDVTNEIANKLLIGDKIALVDNKKETFAFLCLEEKYTFNKEKTAKKIYGTCDAEHPGVRIVQKMNPILLAGKINLIKKRQSSTKAYELSPLQVRRLFETKNWERVLGFHTRNIPHRGHEYIQLKAMEEFNCDGLFIHPIIGRKKIGDFNQHYIIKSYEKLIKDFYPTNKVVLSAFSTFSRYAGPREALFTAICRQNFGCSHFIVGRDHTGVGDFYNPDASHKIFEKFPDLDVEIIRVGEIFYSKKMNKYLEKKENTEHSEDDKMNISCTEIREMLQRHEMPPTWMMRPEISKFIYDSIINNEDVFVTT